MKTTNILRGFIGLLLIGLLQVSTMKNVEAQIDSSLLDSIVSYWTPEGFVYFNTGLVQPGELFTTYKEYFLDDTLNDLVLKKSHQDNILGMDH